MRALLLFILALVWLIVTAAPQLVQMAPLARLELDRRIYLIPRLYRVQLGFDSRSLLVFDLHLVRP